MATLQKNLNTGSLRHKVLTSNIANIDTPNYKAFEVVMEDARKHQAHAKRPVELVRTQPRHFSGRYSSSSPTKIETVDSSGNNFRADGNTVDLDRTMGKLAENTLMYRTAAQIIKKKFQGLKNAIQGGSK
jgi:flagellar basal-body rod protein FlgB